MAGRVGGPARAGGRSGRGGKRRFGLQSEINITPFVDVMLVLLVVFVVTAPFIAVGKLVDPPNADMPPLPVGADPLVIQVAADGAVFVQEKQVSMDDLVDQVVAIRDARAAAGEDLGVVLLQGDGGARFDSVYQVLAVLQLAGLSAGLVSDPEGAEP